MIIFLYGIDDGGDNSRVVLQDEAVNFLVSQIEKTNMLQPCMQRHLKISPACMTLQLMQFEHFSNKNKGLFVPIFQNCF